MSAIFVRLAGFYEQHGTPDFHRFAESLEDRELKKNCSGSGND